jgi:hypothetical protein
VINADLSRDDVNTANETKSHPGEPKEEESKKE